MAITKVAQFASSPASTTDYQAQNAHINAFIQQMTGGVLHLTEWATTTVPQIAQGVYLRHAGVLYIVDTADFTIATGDLSAAGTYYIKLTTSGDSLAVAWEDTLTSYTWSHAYQGLYNGTSQILPYSVVYDGASGYGKKKFDFIESEVTALDYDLVINSDADLAKLGSGNSIEYKRVLVSDGTFAITAQIDLSAHGVVVLEGKGPNSIIDLNYNGTNATAMINCGTELNTLRNFKVISSTTQTNTPHIIRINDSSTFLICNNIIVDGFDDKGNGFYGGSDKTHIRNCMANDVFRGFSTTYNVTGCYATGCSSDGFYLCDTVTSCTSESNTSSGFSGVQFLSSCTSKSNTSDGFLNCNYISSCYAIGNNDNGFGGCSHVSASYSYGNGEYGFQSSNYIVACETGSNTTAAYDALPASEAANDWS